MFELNVLIQVCLVSWDAVSNRTTNRVVEMVLPACGLTGTLGVSLCELKTLQRLDLGGDTVNTVLNSLNGELPECLFALPQLQWLNLESNELEGAALPNTLTDGLNEGVFYVFEYQSR